ncbi:hypothetical protein ACFL0C_00565 [Patescibacteria group bacterium]
MNSIIRNNGKLKVIPKSAARKAVYLIWKGETGMVVARKFRGSFRIRVTSDMRIQFEGFNPSDPMTCEEIKEIFSTLDLKFEEI